MTRENFGREAKIAFRFDDGGNPLWSVIIANGPDDRQFAIGRGSDLCDAARKAQEAVRLAFKEGSS